MALNTAVVVGRLTKDIELKQIGDKSVANFTVAVDKPYNKENEHSEANWIDCVAWGKTAEFLGKYFSKGSRVGITGSLQTRIYENKEGKKVKITEILVSAVDFVESKNSSSATSNSTVESGKTENKPEQNVLFDDMISLDDDDIPF